MCTRLVWMVASDPSMMAASQRGSAAQRTHRNQSTPVSANTRETRSATPSSMRPISEKERRMRASMPSAQSKLAEKSRHTAATTSWRGKRAIIAAPAPRPSTIDSTVIWFGVTGVGIARRAMTKPMGRCT